MSICDVYLSHPIISREYHTVSPVSHEFSVSHECSVSHEFSVSPVSLELESLYATVSLARVSHSGETESHRESRTQSRELSASLSFPATEETESHRVRVRVRGTLSSRTQ